MKKQIFVIEIDRATKAELPLILMFYAMVEMFGDAALFVEMNQNHEFNSAQYAAAMSRIIENGAMRTKMGVVGYSRFIQKYTRKKMLKDTVELYRRIISQS